MKFIKNLSLAIALCISIIAPVNNTKADNVDAKKARQVGAYFMATQFGNKDISSDNLDQVFTLQNMVNNIPALYVFNTADKRGFVIVAGSDCVTPIVAYSTDGAFDPNNIPPNMLWWLNGEASDIVFAQNNELTASKESAEQWRVLEEERLPRAGAKDGEIVRLLTTTWNQPWPYNAQCPQMSGGPSETHGRCYTGCVATAMAQILRYWKYPYVGKSESAYNWNSGTILSANYAQAYYDYDNMPNKLSSNSTQEQINAVALLNYHCGVSVKMDYGVDGSGTQSTEVPKALRMYFKYVKDSMTYISRDDARYRNTQSTGLDNSVSNQNDSNWVNDIKYHILKGRPVYYAGHSPDDDGSAHAGHAFVCDGWNPTTKTLHFNWGWGGSGDCWCNVYLSKLIPNSGYLSTYNFRASHRAVIGITPPIDSLPPQVAIRPVENPFSAEIYPNPANNQITVSINISGNNNQPLQIFDATGRLVKQTSVSPASTTVNIPVNDLCPGVYFCRMQGYTKKFIVQ